MKTFTHGNGKLKCRYLGDDCLLEMVFTGLIDLKTLLALRADSLPMMALARACIVRLDAAALVIGPEPDMHGLVEAEDVPVAVVVSPELYGPACACVARLPVTGLIRVVWPVRLADLAYQWAFRQCGLVHQQLPATPNYTLEPAQLDQLSDPAGYQAL